MNCIGELLSRKLIIVTCYMKRDHLGFFINIEFLTWVDSTFYVEYNGVNDDLKLYYDNFDVLGFILSISGKHPLKIKNCIEKYRS